jgi:hypothetical protein
MFYSYSTGETEPGLKPITVFSFLLQSKVLPARSAAARIADTMEL